MSVVALTCSPRYSGGRGGVIGGPHDFEAPLHSSLGDRMRTQLKKRKKKKIQNIFITRKIPHVAFYSHTHFFLAAISFLPPGKHQFMLYFYKSKGKSLHGEMA